MRSHVFLRLAFISLVIATTLEVNLRFYCPLFNTFLAKMLGFRAVQIRDAD